MLPALLARYPRILAECAVAEPLRRRPEVELHATLFNTPLIYGPEAGREAMAAIYREYIGIARQAGLPLLLAAPTWRLDAQRVADAEVPAAINSDAVAFITALRDEETTSDGPPVLTGALVGPKNDCYRPDLAPGADEAEAFHAGQVAELASTQAAFLLAQTLPNVNEALGVARAMARTDTPYLLSFCTGTDGRILDGTPLPEAMARIDDALTPTAPPAGYFVNCTHPRFLLQRHSPGELERLVGIQANASSRDVTQLDGATVTMTDPVDRWASDMLELHETHGVTVVGGCCGTGPEHLRHLARPGS